MPLMTLSEAQAILTPHLGDVFIEPWLGASENWRRFLMATPNLAKDLDAKTRRNMVHCWAQAIARERLPQLSGIREISALDFFAVAAGDNPVVRFKFVGSGGPSNVSTEAQKLLRLQQYDDEMMDALTGEGVPNPPTILTCGYKLDLTETEVRGIEIRCDYRRELVWSWPIWGDAASGIGDGGGSVEPMPFPDMPGPVPARIHSTRRRRETGSESG